MRGPKMGYNIANEIDITSYKENKKRPDLTKIKIPKLVTLILRPRYSHKKNQNRL